MFVIMLLVPVIVEAQDWPYWRGPNRNGISHEKDWDPKALEGEAKILWKTNVGGGYSAVAIAGEYAYTMGNIDNKDIVYCLKVDSGEEVWRFVYDCTVSLFGLLNPSFQREICSQVESIVVNHFNIITRTSKVQGFARNSIYPSCAVNGAMIGIKRFIVCGGSAAFVKTPISHYTTSRV